MWPSTVALVVAALLFPIADSASGRGSVFRTGSSRSRQEPSSQVGGSEDSTGEAAAGYDVADVGEDAIDNQIQSSSPCSCDCCEVQKLLPRNFVQTSEGTITSTCTKAAHEELGGNEESNALCPSQCQMADGNEILTAAKGSVDYNRFCLYNCRPVADAPGTSCIQLSGQKYEEASNTSFGADLGGNGKETHPEPVLGIGSDFGTGIKVPTAEPEEANDGPVASSGAPAPAAASAAPKAEEVKKQVSAEKGGPQEKLKIVYDMRKLMAERLRAEAGAAVASGAAAAERVRVNRWATKQNADELKKLRVKYAALAGKVEESVADIESNANAADEAESSTKKNLAEGRMFASEIIKETRNLADEMIKTKTAPCAKQAATDRAEAKGLDKPEDWVKVVAARAANPYQKAVTDAVLRTSEYKNLADGLMNQAYGAQKQANELIPHVNMLEAHGDVLGATIEKKQVTNLLSKARALQDEAKGYWNTAQKTRETIPKWQMAAAQAAAYTAWEYSNNAKAFR